MLEAIHSYADRLVAAGLLPEMFSYAFLVNASIVAVIVGPLLGILGTLVVVKRLAFLSEAVGHSALTGIALGVYFGESTDSPWISLCSFSVLFALILQWVKGRTRVPYDTLIGVFLSFALALGAALLMAVAKMVNAHLLDSVLFGSILTAGGDDIAVIAVIALIVGVLSFFYGNEALLTALNPDVAHTLRINTTLHDYGFVLLVALVTVASVKIIGAILVGALLLIPAASARLIAANLRSMLIWAVVIATSSAVLGVLLPMYMQWALATGPAIVLSACLWFLFAIGVNALRQTET
ncbi:MAG: metal ABC transporter permease [Pseudomonadota bacterium]